MSNQGTGRETGHLLKGGSLTELMLHQQELVSVRPKEEKQNHTKDQNDDDHHSHAIQPEEKRRIILSLFPRPVLLPRRNVKEPLKQRGRHLGSVCFGLFSSSNLSTNLFFL